MTYRESSDCAVSREKLHDFVVGALEPTEAKAVSMHIEHCTSCRDALAKEQEWAALVTAMPEAGSDTITLGTTFVSKNPHWVRAPVFAAVLCAILVVAGVLVAALLRARESARIATGAGNLKTIAIVFKLYAQDEGGAYPPQAPVEGILVPDLQRLFPKYVVEPRIFINPRLPDADGRYDRMLRALEESPPNWDAAHRVIAEGYSYLPWATQELEDFRRIVASYAETDVDAGDQDLLAEDGSVALYRFKEGVERFFLTAGEGVSSPYSTSRKQAILPIFFEVVPRPGEEGKLRGSNVLYMDGHVAFVEYGARYPVLPEVAEALAQLHAAP